MFSDFTSFSPLIALKPSGSVKSPVIPVISDLPVLTNTTARVDGPSPGPTSTFMGLSGT